MKKNTGNAIRLGVFVTISAALFIVGVYFIGEQQQLFTNTFKISGIFKDVNGLQVGNNVRFSGITVGTVEDIIIISDTAVQVDMVINESARKFIKKDAKAIIGSEGLMGNKILMITPGTSGKKEIENLNFIETSKPISIDNILIKLQITSDKTADITTDLAAITKNIRSGKGTIGKLFMDTALAKNMDQTLINIKKGAGGFKKNMEAAGHSIFLRGYLKNKEKEEKKKNEGN